MPTRVTVRWYRSRVAYFTTVAPQMAHAQAASECAGAAADQIRSNYSGSLAREVGTPKHLTPLRSAIGAYAATHRYAGMENWGGIIKAKPGKRMLISASRGKIVASAVAVLHHGKYFTDEARKVYLERFPVIFKGLMP